MNGVGGDCGGYIREACVLGVVSAMVLVHVVGVAFVAMVV